MADATPTPTRWLDAATWRCDCETDDVNAADQSFCGGCEVARPDRAELDATRPAASPASPLAHVPAACKPTARRWLANAGAALGSAEWPSMLVEVRAINGSWFVATRFQVCAGALHARTGTVFGEVTRAELAAWAAEDAPGNLPTPAPLTLADIPDDLRRPVEHWFRTGKMDPATAETMASGHAHFGWRVHTEHVRGSSRPNGRFARFDAPDGRVLQLNDVSFAEAERAARSFALTDVAPPIVEWARHQIGVGPDTGYDKRVPFAGDATVDGWTCSHIERREKRVHVTHTDGRATWFSQAELAAWTAPVCALTLADIPAPLVETGRCWLRGESASDALMRASEAAIALGWGVETSTSERGLRVAQFTAPGGRTLQATLTELNAPTPVAAPVTKIPRHVLGVAWEAIGRRHGAVRASHELVGTGWDVTWASAPGGNELPGVELLAPDGTRHRHGRDLLERMLAAADTDAQMDAELRTRGASVDDALDAAAMGRAHPAALVLAVVPAALRAAAVANARAEYLAPEVRGEATLAVFDGWSWTLIGPRREPVVAFAAPDKRELRVSIADVVASLAAVGVSVAGPAPYAYRFADSMLEPITDPAPSRKETPMNATPKDEPGLFATIADDATEGAVRAMANQFERFALEPLAALLQRNLAPDDPSFRGRLATFLQTDVGRALFQGALAGAVHLLPFDVAGKAAIERELRVRAWTGGIDTLVEVFAAPLRKAMSDPLRGSALVAAAPAGIEDGGQRVVANTSGAVGVAAAPAGEREAAR